MKWAKTISSSMLLTLTSVVGIDSMVAPCTAHRSRVPRSDGESLRGRCRAPAP
jgi:hypothetical protein